MGVCGGVRSVLWCYLYIFTKQLWHSGVYYIRDCACIYQQSTCGRKMTIELSGSYPSIAISPSSLLPLTHGITIEEEHSMSTAILFQYKIKWMHSIKVLCWLLKVAQNQTIINYPCSHFAPLYSLSLHTHRW